MLKSQGYNTRHSPPDEHSGEIIYRCDLQGPVTFHNAAFARLLGDDPAVDYTGISPPDLLHP